jgi:hypothetical protein
MIMEEPVEFGDGEEMLDDDDEELLPYMTMRRELTGIHPELSENMVMEEPGEYGNGDEMLDDGELVPDVAMRRESTEIHRERVATSTHTAPLLHKCS